MTEAALFELLSQECRVDSDGAVYYYNAHGQLHRVYGPAVERPNGYRAWFQNDRLHRLDGPAFEHPDGHRAWFRNGQRHRVDGPAVEYTSGHRAWFFNGNGLTEAEWRQAVASMETV